MNGRNVHVHNNIYHTLNAHVLYNSNHKYIVNETMSVYGSTILRAGKYS